MNSKVTAELRQLSEAETQAYVSNTIQVADLLEWILEQTGPADVTVTTFSISEEFLRRIFNIRKKGKLRSLEIVLDFKATNKTLILWPFMAQTVERCFLTDNHSKVLLVSNDSFKVAVVMSQNLTRGNRFEAGYITTDAFQFGRLETSINDIISNHSISFHEIFARTVGQD